MSSTEWYSFNPWFEKSVYCLITYHIWHELLFLLSFIWQIFRLWPLRNPTSAWVSRQAWDMFPTSKRKGGDRREVAVEWDWQSFQKGRFLCKGVGAREQTYSYCILSGIIEMVWLKLQIKCKWMKAVACWISCITTEIRFSNISNREHLKIDSQAYTCIFFIFWCVFFQLTVCGVFSSFII